MENGAFYLHVGGCLQNGFLRKPRRTGFQLKRAEPSGKVVSQLKGIKHVV